MSASSCSLDHPEKLLLRWSEDAFSPSREELVEILEDRVSEAVIRSALRVTERTRVDLVGEHSIESGVVQSCLASGGKFIVTIRMNPAGRSFGPEIDPGVLLVDSFMTEEQEAAILDEIEKEIHGDEFRGIQTARCYLNAYLNYTRCSGTAALNRVLTTFRSSTLMVSASVGQFWDRFRPQTHHPKSATPSATHPDLMLGSVQ